MFLNILVCVDESESSQRALTCAVELAEAGNAKLTLITVAPPVPSFVTLAGVSSELLSADVDRWASDVLETATKTVPSDISTHTIAARGDPGSAIVAG